MMLDATVARARAIARRVQGAQHYVEAPMPYTGIGPSVFLAGGITGCPDWQREVVRLLDGSGIDVLNPRRVNFPIDDPSAATQQITWEHVHLRKADQILFWFPAEMTQPIALYELGAWSMTDKPIFVGADAAYPRRDDVVIQTRLARPEVEVVADLGRLVQQLRAATRRGAELAPAARM